MLRVFILISLVIGISTFIFGQTNNKSSNSISISIPEVALLDIEPKGGNALVLNPVAPTEAGNFLDFSNASADGLWLNYSSVVGSKTEPSRKVTVAISSGYVPEGLQLFVTASQAISGKGRLGAPVGKVRISGIPTDLITGIGSAFTESGENYGHQLSYALVLDQSNESIAQIDFDQTNQLVVTYTLSDN